MAEVAGAAARLVPAGDVAALADALAAGIDDDALAGSLRSRGVARAADFTWSRAAERMVDVYTEALDTPPVAGTG